MNYIISIYRIQQIQALTWQKEKYKRCNRRNNNYCVYFRLDMTPLMFFTYSKLLSMIIHVLHLLRFPRDQRLKSVIIPPSFLLKFVLCFQHPGGEIPLYDKAGKYICIVKQVLENIAICHCQKFSFFLLYLLFIIYYIHSTTILENRNSASFRFFPI